MQPDYQLIYKQFHELSGSEVYTILQLRATVFVVEQNCVYADADGLDNLAGHLMLYYKELLIAYTRIFSPGVIKEEAVIGRVVTHPGYRGKGLGKIIMEESISIINKEHTSASIYLSAQEHLKRFYENLGFQQAGEGYLEDGIPHIPMVRNATS